MFRVVFLLCLFCALVWTHPVIAVASILIGAVAIPFASSLDEEEDR